MTYPPSTLDGAACLKVAHLDPKAWSKTRHTVNAREVQGIAALVLARYPSDRGIYLFYCDKAWIVLTDTYHDDIDSAVAQAKYEFGQVDFINV